MTAKGNGRTRSAGYFPVNRSKAVWVWVHHSVRFFSPGLKSIGFFGGYLLGGIQPYLSHRVPVSDIA